MALYKMYVSLLVTPNEQLFFHTIVTYSWRLQSQVYCKQNIIFG